MVILDGLNMFFTLTFFLEMIFKLLGLGVKQYTADPSNLFDAFIVFVSLIEVYFNQLHAIFFPKDESEFASGLSALRAFRLSRVLKLARSNFSLRILLDSIA